MKLTFTEAEYTKLSSIFDKLMKQRAKLPDSEWKKDNNKIIKQLASKFAQQVMPTSEHEIHLDRKQLRFIESALITSMEVLTTKIIPEYKKRGGLEEYESRAQQTVEMYSNILKKVEAAL